ncbi:MAG: DUF177 domain-containing protein [Lentisphaeria bacterium]|nr:DUF177 domain-containing protein [Lentisphaeria bacterium]
MKKNDRALIVHVDSVPLEGCSLTGEVSPGSLDLPTEGRGVFKTPVTFDLFLSLVEGKLLAQGKVETRFEGYCDRCLEPFDQPLAIDDVCWFFEDVDNETIDLTESLREDILLHFPQRLLCDSGCLGLCPLCGRALVDGVCDCETVDCGESPWSALDGFDTH